ncbi:hypothetical protein [Pyxidicoccus sp. MSG2]|nr:hypothetical protein [Pyxidicoccus sp. MSG2]MCY1023882.1 hypothetical protein [Pyxidicoccus sp. MSG2]
MFFEVIVGVVLITLLIVVLGPALWSSRLSITEKQKHWEQQGKKRPGAGD